MSSLAEDGSRASHNKASRDAFPASLGTDKELPPIPEVIYPPGKVSEDSSNVAPDEIPKLDTSGKSNGREGEANDYLNGGLPHEHISPVLSDSAIQQSPVPLSPIAEATSNTVENGADATPGSPAQGRKSVQFSRPDALGEPAIHNRTASVDTVNNPSKSRAFMSRLKAIAIQNGLPTPRIPGAPLTGSESAPQSTASSPTAARGTRPGQGAFSEEGSDVDADAEETADESVAGDATDRTKKRRKRMRRPRQGSSTNPIPPGAVNEPDSPVAHHSRVHFLQRRATMPDPADHRVGMSEGEGRDHLSREIGWRRGNSWVARSEDPQEAESPSGRRVGHVRRISLFGGGGVSDGDAATPRRPFLTGDRASTFGAQKWRQVKNTLKLLRQKKEERFDYYKSAELMAELRAGAPAVLMLASMIQRDEHGHKRIPVLLEQLKLKITDSAPVQDGDSERHWIFTIDLEYGSGPSRMKWTVKRTIREILELHWKYKLALRNDKYLRTVQAGARPKQPHFPISAFPYVRGLRGVDMSDEEDAASVRGEEPVVAEAHAEAQAEAALAEASAGEGTATDIEGRPGAPAKRRKSRMAVLGMSRRGSAVAGPDPANLDAQAQALIDEAAAKRKYVERQQRMLEKYLQEMVRWLMFRADSNRLCRFLELSALGVRLAAEGSYHGKECFLHIQSSKGLDFRRVLTPTSVIDRHSRKWFLVRQSYIVCVESPENMNIYDVYLVDSKFRILSKKGKLKQITSKKSGPAEIDLTTETQPHKHHTLNIQTSERKVKLWARKEQLIRQFEESITEMLKMTPWHQQNRFDSFAPVRTGVFAQWLVDGRDYMWNVSRAIAMAKDVIYIHDWWLSPELYMRRPACISQKWRLDRLLQRKASEGVKIFVIIYRNVEAAIPIDSEYTKFSLLNLHPNIFVQRSPNQFKKNQFFFAHHEKICVVDHDVAFVGGIDLCFGRWDSPQHNLADDKPTGFEVDETPKDADHCQLWPGKDYSNPRVQDFFSLREPYKEMYDRTKVPRMPWHDIAMQVVGQPARDLTRHFVQRWNYVRRGRKPTRPTPFLLPPPDCKTDDLERLGLTGTCDVQILRSASAWSLGIEETESSIQSAYITMIEESEHFVYMENQFFITSTETLGVKIVNRIGDALVDRIMRANEKDEDWRCVIIIPLMPGFQSSVADQDGTSVRLILQCQYRSICRGENSIFGRLRAVGIEPEDYIQFFSLRQWGKINHKTVLTTEQLYIHAKAIIVDDRVALIGSANINERSLLGERDSECAAIVRDRDMIWSTMAGSPYQVGRFAHTLRLRLMREHLGLDTDEIMEEERQADLEREADFEAEMDQLYNGEESDASAFAESSAWPRSHKEPMGPPPRLQRSPSFNYNVDLDNEAYDTDRRSSRSKGSKDKDSSDSDGANMPPREEHQQDVEGYGNDHWKQAEKKGTDRLRDSVVVAGHEMLVHNAYAEGEGPSDFPEISHHPHSSAETVTSHGHGTNHETLPPFPRLDRRTTDQLGLLRANQLPTIPPTDDTDIGGPPLQRDASGKPTDRQANPLTADIKLAHITKDCMRDPLNPSFYDEVWSRVAENNTKIYRRVFRCMPDSEVRNWHDFQEYTTYATRFQESMEGRKKSDEPDRKTDGHPSKQTSAGVGIGAPAPSIAVATVGQKLAAAAAKTHPNTEHAVNEKEPLPPTPPPKHESKPDMEKAAAEADLKEHSRSLASRGKEAETPFPVFDESHSSHLLGVKPDKNKERRTTFSAQERPEKPTPGPSTLSPAAAASAANAATAQTNASNNIGSVRRRRRATTKSSRRGFQGTDELLNKGEAEEVLSMTQGHLVQFPYDWLLVEEGNGNWLYQVDQVAPLQIYN